MATMFAEKRATSVTGDTSESRAGIKDARSYQRYNAPLICQPHNHRFLRLGIPKLDKEDIH